jgi:spermidine synthase
MHLSDQLTIKTIRSASQQDLKRLYQEAGWWDASCERHPEFLDHIVRNSALFAGVFFQKKLIGMGRALSDLASDAYIQDVTVLKEFRGRGIGKKIIRLLIKELKENKVDWIGLIAQPGTASFYTELGFEPLEDHVPLKYKGYKD